MDFERTRTRLYRLSFAVNALVLPGFLIAIAILGTATEPVAQWPAEIVRFFTPGLPANLIDAALRFPVQMIVLAAFVAAIFRMNRVVKLEDDEYAFQTWLRVGVATPPPMPAMAPTARIIARIAAVWWVLPVLPVLMLALGPGWVPDASDTVAVQGAKMDASAKTQSPCIGACSPRRLARGETIHVTVAARRKRNETGLLLTRGEAYTARCIRSEGWRDGSYSAGPHGVEFEGLTRFLARGVEWLRPYPQGDWFQLIGRIDRGRDVFPMLDQQEPGEPFAFRAPDDGELVLLVNDVIYGNNRGFLTVEIRSRAAPQDTLGSPASALAGLRRTASQFF